MQMSESAARSFLREHQPMPIPLTDDALIERYVAAVEALQVADDEEAVTLLLGSLSRGIGFFETVLDRVVEKPQAVLTNAIRSCMSRAEPMCIYWACLAAYEAPDPALLPPLVSALASESVDVRVAAAGALGELGDEGRSHLEARLAVDSDPDVREAIEQALG